MRLGQVRALGRGQGKQVQTPWAADPASPKPQKQQRTPDVPLERAPVRLCQQLKL